MRLTEAVVILQHSRWDRLKSILMSGLFFCQAPVMLERNFAQPAQISKPDPWDPSQVMMPADLARLLAKQEGKRPLVVSVGFVFLYKGTHIPMSEFEGPGKEAKGIEALKTWAGRIKRNKEVVIYCGCCPMKECPNIRPAFLALRQMGLKRLKVLYLENNLAKDWVDNSFATEKGSQK